MRIVNHQQFIAQMANAERMARSAVAELVARGYRRTSWSHGMASRIDRPDWVEFMAKEMGRAPADFYIPGESKPSGNWCDHYRRVYSKDTVMLEPVALIGLIPTSNWDDTGYVEIEREVK